MTVVWLLLWFFAAYISITAVVIKHPWSLSPREFYVGYQPWITIVYALILACPPLTALAIQHM
jgi:hypothetical protein